MQVQAACQVPWLEEVILDFLEVHGLKEAVSLVKQAGKRCIVCTPRSGPTLAPVWHVSAAHPLQTYL